MKANHLWTSLFCLSIVGIGGCYRHTFVVGRGANTDQDPSSSFWQAHFLAGLIGSSDVDVKKVCPSGNATLKDRQSFLNSLVAALTISIYTPTTVEVYCEGKTAALNLSGRELKRIALAPGAVAWAKEVSLTRAANLEAAIETYRSTHKNVANADAPSTY